MSVNAAKQQRLFAYGTLQDERVIRAVTGRVFSAVPAVLPGYCRYRVKEADYPGVLVDGTGSVDGLLLLDVDAASMAALDAFEGEYYERRLVEVVTSANERCECSCYIIRDAWRHLLTDEPWALEEFQRSGYQRFRDTYPNF